MTHKELTTIIDAFNASRPKNDVSEAYYQWTRCVNSFITFSVTRNTLTETQVDNFYHLLNERRTA